MNPKQYWNEANEKAWRNEMQWQKDAQQRLKKPIKPGRVGESCDAWLAEGRIIPHEVLTEDGLSFCAHCNCRILKDESAEE